MDNTFPLLDSLRGIREHHERVMWFVSLADAADNSDQHFRLLMAAVYFARGIVELMLEAAKAQELPNYCDKDEQKCRKAFEEQFAPKLPHYSLIEKIRIHDFHRVGCIPPNSKRQEVVFSGPMKLTASKGAAGLAIIDSRPQVTLTGNSTVTDQRSLCYADGSFYDEMREKYLPLRQILTEFLEKVPDTIKWFEQQRAG